MTPPGFHINPQGFNHLGSFTAQFDVVALNLLAAHCYLKFGPLRIAEVGSFAGTTTLELAKYAHTLYCVDTWKGAAPEVFENGVDSAYRDLGGDHVYETFLANVKHLPCVRPLRMPSVEAAKLIEEPLHLVFIDADHAEAAVRADVEAWMPLVIPGGLICGHDYSEPFPGVMKVADSLPKTGFVNAVWWKDLP